MNVQIRGARVGAVAILLGAAVVAFGAEDDWESRRAALKDRARPLILNSDGNELVYYPTNAPISFEGFVSRRLASYRGTKVSTVSYCPWSSGFGMLTTTRAGELFDRPIDLVRGCTNATCRFAAAGLDCLDMTSRFCRTNGLEVFVSLRMNDTHDVSYLRPGTNPPRSWLFPKWKAEHPECLFGTDAKGGRPPHGAWTAVDFENPETRAYMKRFVRDLVRNYDVDGIEYDFMRHGAILKSVGWGAEATDAQCAMMTGFMRELREITESAGREKGRPLLVLVRTADSVGYARATGIDVEAWMKARVLDIWSVSDYFQLDYLKPNAELAHRYGVKFVSALAESRIERYLKSQNTPPRLLPGRNSIASFAAEYAAAQAAGCDGVESFNLSCILWALDAAKLLQVDPRRTEGMDKTYFALVRGTGGYRPGSWLRDGDRFYRRPRIDPGRRFAIPTGEAYVFGMELGDDPSGGGRATVRALFESAGSAIRTLAVNGREIAPASVRDGLHVYELPADCWHRGYNEFSVTPDPRVGKRAVFNDFSLAVTYGRKEGK